MSIKELANAIRKRNEAAVTRWAKARIAEKDKIALAIKRTAEGKKLLAEREALTTEYNRKIRPVEDRWTTLKAIPFNGPSRLSR